MFFLRSVFFGVFLFGSTAYGALSPLAISAAPPVQFPPSDYNVTGVRVNLLVGNHRNVSGIDLGVVGNMTQQKFVGLALAGGFNYTKGQATLLGLQLAGLANINIEKTQVYGLQAALANYNEAESRLVGVMLGLANISAHTTVAGFQFGIYNRAKSVYGLQVGLVNIADNLHGLQIGLMNFHKTGLFYVSPVLNVGF